MELIEYIDMITSRVMQHQKVIIPDRDRGQWLSSLQRGDKVRSTYGDGSPRGRLVTLIARDGDQIRISGLGTDGNQSTGWISDDWIDPASPTHADRNLKQL